MLSWLKNLLGLSQKPVVPKQQIHNLSLYYFSTCPFCRTVLRQMDRLNIEFPLRNINQEEKYRQELIKNGGRKTVPCLRIEKQNGDVQWMYESMDIVEYLNKRFASKD